MILNTDKKNHNQDSLYNKILLLSRNKLFYSNFNLQDSFQNRINLIFFHISFLLINIKKKNLDSIYKKFYQQMFDYIFNQIEINMRELGHGDVTVNKNMKFLVKVFYDILLNCENYSFKNEIEKAHLLKKHLIVANMQKSSNYDDGRRRF